MELAHGYATKYFMLTYQCHTSYPRDPSLFHTDRGSQLVAANKEISANLFRYNWDVSTTLVETQWMNGAANSFVKKLKHIPSSLQGFEAQLRRNELCRQVHLSHSLSLPSVSSTIKDWCSWFWLSFTTHALDRSVSGPPKDSTLEDPPVRADYLHKLETAWSYQYESTMLSKSLF